MKTIDVRGKLCPEPLIITKKAIKVSSQGDNFAVLLDNDIATCNLEDFLWEMGIESQTVKDGALMTIHFTIGGAPVRSIAVEPFCAKPVTNGDYVVVLASSAMGTDDDGSNKLGKVLMRGFINSLSQQDILPRAIVMYNSGVLTTVKDADTLESLKELSASGVDIILCGVCVDYYNIKDEFSVGRISNMMEITKITTTASHIVYP